VPARCPPPGTRPGPGPAPLRLAQVLRAGLPGYARSHRLPSHHWKVLNAIQACRTPLLGGHLYQCAHCQRAHFAPHSCGNRHCPSCQAIHSQYWLAAQAKTVLPIPYFHLVFTLPHELNPLLRQNPQALYDLLFAAASDTLLTFGRNNLGAQLGVTAVLHTWSQTLLDHYHLHCIVSGGGLCLEGKRWVGSRPDYLFNVQALGQVFRAKFCQGLQALYAQGRLQFHGSLAGLAAPPKFQALVRQATRHNWVVYSKRPFAGPQQVLAYLSRYTHRVGITNARLQRLDPTAATISFDYKDYAQGARHKIMTLSLEQFIGRLRLHLLPPRFVKIRHYGLLSNRGHHRRLAQARALLAQAPPAPSAQPWPNLPSPKLPVPGAWPICPHCGWATLVLVRVVQPQHWVAPPATADTS
jgi:hypothetical protein